MSSPYSTSLSTTTTATDALVAEGYRRRPAVHRPFPDLATMEKLDTIRTYRFTRPIIEDLTAQLSPHLQPGRPYPTALTDKVKVMAALNFFATGTFQYTVATSGGMPQTMFSRVLLDVFWGHYCVICANT